MFYQFLSCSPVEELWPASFKVLCHFGRDSVRSPAKKRRRCFPWIAPAKQWPRECWQHLGMKKGLINHGELMNIDQLWVGLKIVGPNPNLIINHGESMDIPMKCPFLVPVPHFQTHPYAVAMMKHHQKKIGLKQPKWEESFDKDQGMRSTNHGGWPIKWWFQWQ